jgi:hypothetical protein
VTPSSSTLISLRPSDAERWTTCTAAPQHIVDNAERIPNQDTEYSVEGNLAHDCAENYVLGKKAPKGCPADMKAHARAYADFVEPFKMQEGVTEWGVEKKINLFYMPTRHGYVDFFSLSPKRVVIVDLKYGQGVAVYAEENKQMAIYARSLIEQNMLLAADEMQIEMHIWQPRVREGRTHTKWVVTWAELKQFTDEQIVAIADLIVQGKTKFQPSDKACRFCPAKTFCEPRAQWLADGSDILQSLISDPAAELPAKDTLPLDMLAKLADRGKEFGKWLDDITEYLTAMALEGTPVPDHKIVLSKGGHLKWTDPAAAAKLLRQMFSPKELYKKTLATPKQVLDALAAKHAPEDYVEAVQALMIKPSGNPTLAPVSDPCEEYRPYEALLSELPDLTATEEDWV